MQLLPSALPIWVSAAVVGGLIGTELGTRQIATGTFRVMLAVVLVIAGGKLVLGV
jgi:hypothetical protein